MKALTFIAITLLSGVIAGTILALVNQGVVEPFIEQAIELENQQAAANGEIVNPTELAAFRLWQKGGSIAAVRTCGTLEALLCHKNGVNSIAPRRIPKAALMTNCNTFHFILGSLKPAVFT